MQLFDLLTKLFIYLLWPVLAHVVSRSVLFQFRELAVSTSSELSTP